MRCLPLVGQKYVRWHDQKSRTFLEESVCLHDAGASRWSAVTFFGDTAKKNTA
jgi:hypothetical protein